jgi:hypothetical protein
MNGARISHILLSDPYAGHQFGGFGYPDFPIAVNKKPALFFLNTDFSFNPGEHWCVVYFVDDVCEFFDPYGLGPEHYNLDTLIDGHCLTRVNNQKRVQGFDEKTCGHHCLFFSLHRCRGISFHEIMTKHYSSDVDENDKLVFDFMKRFGRIMSEIQNV